jgi:hypothetical protein
MARIMPEPDESHRSVFVRLIEAGLEKLGPGVTDQSADEIFDREHFVEQNWVRLREGMGADCRPCIHAALFGWWGPPLIKDLNASTHCHRCHRSWRGVKEAHCVICCEQFASNEASSLHWVDDGHMHPSEVKGRTGKPRFTKTPSEFGDVWVISRFLVGES